jgi:hypothetical protein
MKTILLRYLDFASRTRCLVVTGLLMVLSIVVFYLIPVIGGRLIDLLPHYSHETMMALLESYGEEGRRLHVLATPTLDTLFPVIYVTFYAGLIHRLKPRSWLLALAPICLGVVDMCENTHIVMMLVQYPDVAPGLVKSASVATFVKHRFTNLTLLIALVMIVLRVVQRIKSR